MSTQPAVSNFADLALPEPLQKALADVGYETPSAIQAATIPALLDGRDVLLHQLMAGDRLAVLLPLLRIGSRLGQTILDDAEAASGHTQPAAYQSPHGDLETVAFRTEQIGCGNLMIR